MKIKRLQIDYQNKLLVSLNFTVNRSLALVGQSGSGKSLTLKALLGMLPADMIATLDLESDFELTKGANVSFVPQNPFTALSPLTKIKDHFLCDSKRQVELLKMVGLADELLDRYPPELSGGQLQRVVIMIALEFMPKLLLLDEPTTALDYQNRVMIIELLTYLQEEFDFKILFVTHDMESARGLCEDIVVIKDGRVVEEGRLFEVMNDPKHPYTQELIESNFAQRKFRA